MTKIDEILRLLSKNFRTGDFCKVAKADSFSCPHEKECGVKKTKEPIWSPSVGDNNTSVMIVAEAPSSEGGPGPHIGGFFAERKPSKKSPLHRLREFVKDNYGTVPYFTNLVKCGIAKQQSKNILKKRADNCIECLLLEEIRIMEPELILCVGGLSHLFLKKYQSAMRIDAAVRLVPLMHYSMQAQLPVNIDDKTDIIWRWQVGKLTTEEIARIPLSQLSYFRKGGNRMG